MDVNCNKYINLEYMEMMSDGDEAMKKIMLEMLLEELPQEINKMVAICQEAKWSELSAVSHKLKSTLAFVGNDEMTAANKNIETFAKGSAEIDQIPGLIQTLASLCPNTVSELNQELARL
ncbi:MAG: HPt (histidine-containing phosphotransfer) domain-containing protein [Saprospiraceae bacterium]|jgi:HPt (histidine-containing phosphotransfer) domain-containing protein